MSKYIRHPKTTAERRCNEAHELEGVKIRKKRKLLPTAWDDMWRRPQRSWKNQRRTQWK